MKKLVVIICVGVCAFFLYAINHPLDENLFTGKSDSNQVKQLKEEVTDYLINVKGYKTSEILNIEGLYTELKDRGYSVYVKFKDEPNTTYEYQKKDGKIIMMGISDNTIGGRKHAEGMWKD